MCVRKLRSEAFGVVALSFPRGHDRPTTREMTIKPPHRLFVAVDTPDLDAALAMTDGLKGAAGLGIKLGLEFFGAHGPAGVKAVTERVGAGTIFLDLKFHDIPNTVAGAIRAVVPPRPPSSTCTRRAGRR